MSDFIKFRNAVQKQFDLLAKAGGILFVSKVEKDKIWDTYLSSFPEGANPLFRERTEHDCQCCKSFIRSVGRVLGQDKQGELASVWDINVGGKYQAVADALSKLNKEGGIGSLFLHSEREVGRDHNVEILDDGSEIIWNHFHQVIPNFAYAPHDLSERKGDAATHCKVLKRSLSELTDEAIDIVSDLITSNAIYRGEEHKGTVNLIKQLKRELVAASNQDLFLWKKAVELKGVSALRNTVIGSLITDISEGVDLEVAVKSFEAKVAPQNYKRSSAVVTGKMKENAQKTAKDLGIEPSLLRRYATKEDISVSDVLFADQTVKPFMEDSVFDVIKPQNTTTSKTNELDKVQSVPVDKFLTDILPKVDSIELFVENKHTANLVSLIAPQHKSAPCIMKWGNNFSWSYNGDVTDSMKEQVKQKGGCVEGALRFSIRWNDGVENKNDLDAHCITPKGEEIYFGYKYSYLTTGTLDVDIISPHGVAVENIIFKDQSKMPEGSYKFFVDNFSERGGRDFDAQVEFAGQIFEFSYKGGFKSKARIPVATVDYTKKGGFKITEHMPSSVTTKEVWSLQTQQFHKVNMVMQSPNHWEDSKKSGNKHLFFMLDGCNNKEDIRGFYNEYLIEELNPHRKVFEVLAGNLKAKYNPNEEQLSGVGFSSTISNEVILRVKGKYNRVIKVVF